MTYAYILIFEMTIKPNDNRAYQPSSLLIIEPINHQAHWPSSLSTIEPVNHNPFWPSSLSYQVILSTIKPINFSSSFATSKPFGLFFWQASLRVLVGLVVGFEWSCSEQMVLALIWSSITSFLDNPWYRDCVGALLPCDDAMKNGESQKMNEENKCLVIVVVVVVR